MLACLLATAAVLTACTSGEDPDPEPTGTPAPIKVVDLTFGVWGTEEEIAAYQDVVDLYDEMTDEVTIDLESFETHEELLDAVEAGDVPDVFLVQRGDLSYLLDNDVTQPIGERLDERDVQFGDDYSRAALEAFSFDRDLQCMPYGVSPYVVYYNTNLVDFDRMAERGLNVPNLDPDAEAALVARRVPGRRRVRDPAAPRHQRPSTCRRRSTGWRRSSSPAAATSSTTTTTRRRWRSPPTTAAPRSRRSCRSCATRS